MTPCISGPQGISTRSRRKSEVWGGGRMEWYLAVNDSNEQRPRQFPFGVGKTWLSGRYVHPTDAVARASGEGASGIYLDGASYMPLEADFTINRWHFTVCHEEAGAWITECSRHGTHLNGKLLTPREKTPLGLDDEIQVAKCRVFVSGTATIDQNWLRWNDAAIQHIAARIHQENSLNDLPILADALEEAGCNDPFLLKSCRQRNVNAKRSWVLELLLGLD